jgi:hypothetical protein
MPKGPKGEKRPADVVGAAVMIAKIATGEVEDKVQKFKLRHYRKSRSRWGRPDAYQPRPNSDIWLFNFCPPRIVP